MYTIYVDDEVLYSPLLANEGYQIINGKVTTELNKAGSFKFTIPPNNVMYDNIQKLKSIVKVVSSDEYLYSLKNKDKTEKSVQTSIPTTVLYQSALVDEEGRITLINPLNPDGSSAIDIEANYKNYPYFYGDLNDGTQDSTVNKFTTVSRTISTGQITIAFYAYTYYSQETIKESKSKDIFIGRILHDEKDFYKIKSVYCEGQLAFLLDSIQRPYTFQGDIPDLFKQFLNNHNSQVDDWKQFQVGSITVRDANNYINRESSQYPNTFDELIKKLIDTHGGYLIPRIQNGKRYLDYLKESGKTNSQVIEFGVNLLDITEYITAEDVFTVLIPLGAEQEDEEGNITGRLTIESVNDGKDYIENELGISLFGRITKVHEWDDVTIADNLMTKGTAFLESGIEMSINLTLNAIDLHLVDVNTESISIGDYVRVISQPHGIDTLFQCTKIELDIIEPDKSLYTFGLLFTTLTDKLNKNI